MNGCIIITNGYIIWANVNIKYDYITTDEWMHDNDMDVQDGWMQKCILIFTWLNLEHTLRIGPFNFSGKEKQSCLFWFISVLKKIYKEGEGK